MNPSSRGYVPRGAARTDALRGCPVRGHDEEGSLMAARAEAPAGAERANQDQETQ